jgi:hypothetical protein
LKEKLLDASKAGNLEKVESLIVKEVKNESEKIIMIWSE